MYTQPTQFKNNMNKNTINLTKDSLDESKPQSGMELVIGKKDGSIDNASIPVRWCLTKVLLDNINESEYHSPQVCIQVQYMRQIDKNEYTDYWEERHLFPLNQFIAYVPLSKSGRVCINAYILGMQEGELKCYSIGALQKDSIHSFTYNHFDTRVYMSVESKTLNYDIDIKFIAKALNYNINIPEELFGKKPPQWILNLINRYQDTTLVDECQLRRRFMFFPLKLLFIIPELFLRVISMVFLYLCYALVGFVDIPKYYFKHPLTYSCFSMKDMGIHYIKKIVKAAAAINTDDIPLNQLFIIGLKIFHRIPLIWILSILIAIQTLITWGHVLSLPLQILILVLTPLIIYTCILIFVGIVSCIVLFIQWIISWIHVTGGWDAKILEWCSAPYIFIGMVIERIIIALEDRENRKNKAKLMKLERYLTCNNDPHSVTANVDDIPYIDRTPTLIYTNFKNKICKPLSR